MIKKFLCRIFGHSFIFAPNYDGESIVISCERCQEMRSYKVPSLEQIKKP